MAAGTLSLCVNLEQEVGYKSDFAFELEDIVVHTNLYLVCHVILILGISTLCASVKLLQY